MAGREPRSQPARVLSGVDVHTVDDLTARRAGEHLRHNQSADLVDAHVALLAQLNDQIVTSDEPDIKALLRARKLGARTVAV